MPKYTCSKCLCFDEEFPPYMPTDDCKCKCHDSWRLLTRGEATTVLERDK